MLAGEFLGQHPGYSERAGSLLLGLLTPFGVPFGKLPAAALRALKTINHPLFAGGWPFALFVFCLSFVAACPKYLGIPALHGMMVVPSAAWSTLVYCRRPADDVQKINNC